MKTYCVGMDVSKGYVDVAVVNDSGSVMSRGRRFDDTGEGHKSFQAFMESTITDFSKTEVRIGLESSGGLEKNWLHFIKTQFPSCKVYRLNPLAVKKFNERRLHRSVNDQISALNIAHYLRIGISPDEVVYEPGLDGAAKYYRHVRNEIEHCARLQNELHSLLMQANPEMEKYCRSGFSDWVLKVLHRYPTSRELARASLTKLSSIPYVTQETARKLINDAKSSAAGQTDSLTGATIRDICNEILRLSRKIEKSKKVLCDSLSDDATVKVWVTFPGIGIWSASCLRLEFGSMERFYSAEAAVAYTGLDPCVEQSGDGRKDKGISRRGRRQIRAILYPAALCAIRCNKVIGEFYSRLRSNGKPHLRAAVACMRKTVAILYAMAITEKPFDPDYEEKLRNEKKSNNSANEPSLQETRPPQIHLHIEDSARNRSLSEKSAKNYSPNPRNRKQGKILIEAPVTRLEAKKRREKLEKLQADDLHAQPISTEMAEAQERKARLEKSPVYQ